jgi:hypothetical protein
MQSSVRDVAGGVGGVVGRGVGDGKFAAGVGQFAE